MVNDWQAISSFNFSYSEQEIRSISAKEEKGVLIYPRLTHDLIYIDSNNGVNDISIFNGFGQKILSKSSSNQIDLSTFTNGLYFIKISDGVNTSERKIIKY